jgi:hypothetical protein
MPSAKSLPRKMILPRSRMTIPGASYCLGGIETLYSARLLCLSALSEGWLNLSRPIRGDLGLFRNGKGDANDPRNPAAVKRLSDRFDLPQAAPQPLLTDKAIAIRTIWHKQD